MRLYILENGKLVGSKRNSIADADPSEMQTAPIWSVLIDHPDGYILLDAGCHTDKSRQHPMIYKEFSMSPEDHIVSRLAALNVSPSDVKKVVVSHLHADHTGFLELFTNAEFYVHENELGERLKLYALQDSSAGSLGDIELWLTCRLKWNLIKADEKSREIARGVTILNFGPGHAFGMLGLLVELPKTGKILLAGDAVYNHENAGPPVKLAGNMYDKDGFVSTIESVVKYAGDIGAQLWYGHDEEQYSRLIKSTEGYYE